MLNRLLLCAASMLLAVGCATDPAETAGERGTQVGKADTIGSCVDSCGGQSQSGSCWCDAQCAGVGDCCTDIQPVCEPAAVVVDLTCWVQGPDEDAQRIVLSEASPVATPTFAGIDTQVMIGITKSTDVRALAANPVPVTTGAGAFNVFARSAGTASTGVGANVQLVPASAPWFVSYPILCTPTGTPEPPVPTGPYSCTLRKMQGSSVIASVDANMIPGDAVNGPTRVGNLHGPGFYLLSEYGAHSSFGKSSLYVEPSNNVYSAAAVFSVHGPWLKAFASLTAQPAALPGRIAQAAIDLETECMKVSTGGGTMNKVFFQAGQNLIPDNSPVGVTLSNTVDESFIAKRVRVSLPIRHTSIGDLRIELTHNGKTAVLYDRTGGEEDNLYSTVTAPAFAGESVAGTWTLKIMDLAGSNVGTVGGGGEGWPVLAIDRP